MKMYVLSFRLDFIRKMSMTYAAALDNDKMKREDIRTLRMLAPESESSARWRRDEMD